MKKLKIFAMLAILLAGMFVSTVSAQKNYDEMVPVEIEDVWVNGDRLDFMCYWDENGFDCGQEIRGDIERGETVDVRVKVLALEDADITLEADLNYKHSDRHDLNPEVSFPVKAGRTYYKTLSLTLPEDMDNEDVYALRIEISDQNRWEVSYRVLLEVSTPEHSIKIDDVLFSPGTTVQAGRSLLTSVRLENFGQKDEDNVKVTFSIPELGVADYDYIEEIEADDQKMTQELYVRIPADAENKDYEAVVSADYDDGYETVTKKFTISVIGGQPSAEAGKTVLTVGPETQNIVAGGNEAVYPIAITNSGSESRTYTLALTTGDWATSRLSENVLVIQPEETKVAYAYVAADKNTAAGEKIVSLKVTSGDLNKEVTLKASVVDNSNGWDSAKRALEIGLVVLVILLVIIGLIIGFSRLKNKEEDDEDEDKTYY